MIIRNRKLQLVLAVAVVAMVALPGAASQALPGTEATAQVIVAAPQPSFGLFLDPHAEPVLHIELPTRFHAL